MENQMVGRTTQQETKWAPQSLEQATACPRVGPMVNLMDDQTEQREKEWVSWYLAQATAYPRVDRKGNRMRLLVSVAACQRMEVGSEQVLDR